MNDEDSFDPRMFTQKTEEELREMLEENVFDFKDMENQIVSNERRNEVMMEMLSIAEPDDFLDTGDEPPPLAKRDGTLLTESAKKDLKPGNEKTAKKYEGYVADFFNFNENEGGAGITDEVTLCNFFSFLKHNRFKAGCLWNVYTAINAHHQNVTGGQKLERYVLLNKLLHNSTRNYVTKKSAVFSGKQIDILFNEKLDDDDPVHL